MKKFLIFLPALLLIGYVFAEEEYEIEESSGDDICVPEEECEGQRYYYPQRYNNCYEYEDRDIDATWPGKQENSFMDQLMR